MDDNSEIDRLAINTIRMLAVDAVQKANSGHPGTPMDAAPTAYALWQQVLRYDPANPHWINRDRFVLSAGHACMLLYALIHLTGIRADDASYPPGSREAVTLDDIKTFRQPAAAARASRIRPHHRRREHHRAAGAGRRHQRGDGGRAALARGHLQPAGFSLFDFNVFALCGDGDMMEGVASEGGVAGQAPAACRTSAGSTTATAFPLRAAPRSRSPRTRRRGFLAYGWNVTRVTDPNDLSQLRRAYGEFLATSDRPTMIVVHSHIGYGSPHKHDSAEAHGEPLGVEEVRLTKEFFDFDPDVSFHIPPGVRERFAEGIGARGAKCHAAWVSLFSRYRAAHPGACRATRLRHGQDTRAGLGQRHPELRRRCEGNIDPAMHQGKS